MINEKRIRQCTSLATIENTPCTENYAGISSRYIFIKDHSIVFESDIEAFKAYYCDLKGRDLVLLGRSVFKRTNYPAEYSSALTITDYDINKANVSAYHEPFDPRTRDPTSSYFIPAYFSIFGSDRPLVTKPILLPPCKVQKNIRPKGTHTHRKFYR